MLLDLSPAEYDMCTERRGLCPAHENSASKSSSHTTIMVCPIGSFIPELQCKFYAGFRSLHCGLSFRMNRLRVAYNVPA